MARPRKKNYDPAHFKAIQTNLSELHAGKGKELEPGLVKRALASPMCLHPIVARDGKPFYSFSRIGTEIEGWLGREYDNALYCRTKSRMIQTPENGWIEFFCNKQLQRIFKKNHSEGKYLRIRYVGDMKTRWSHRMKIYQVWEVPADDRKCEKQLHDPGKAAVNVPASIPSLGTAMSGITRLAAKTERKLVLLYYRNEATAKLLDWSDLIPVGYVDLTRGGKPFVTELGREYLLKLKVIRN